MVTLRVWIYKEYCSHLDDTELQALLESYSGVRSTIPYDQEHKDKVLSQHRRNTQSAEKNVRDSTTLSAT